MVERGDLMIISLSDERRIVGTESCWELQRRKLGNGRWRPYKYFHKLGSAVQEAALAEIRLDPAANLSEALKAVESVVRKYERLIDDAVEGVAFRADTKLRAVS